MFPVTWLRATLRQAVPCVVLSVASLAAGALPESFSITVTNAGQPRVLQLERYNLRAPGFTVRVYTNATEYYNLTSLPEVPTYRGRVQGDPRAVVSAMVKPDGKLRAQVVYGNWYEPADPVLGTTPWSVDGIQTAYFPSNTYVYVLTTNMPTTVSAGTYPAFTNGFGGPRYVNNMQKFIARRCNIVVDIMNDFFVNNCGSSLFTALAKAESQMNDADLVTARDDKIAYQVTCVSIRAVTQDPFSGITSGGTLLSLLSSAWSPERSSLPFDKVHCFTSNGYGAGGMAYAPGDFSYTMDSGYYGGVICHEVGHNWWAKDYEATKDYTGTNSYRHAMNGSGLTYCPESVNRALANARGKSLAWINYNYPLPPYAAPDYASATKNTARTLDVLLNDYDINSNALAVVWFSTSTAHGGTVALTSGQLRYTPATNFVGTDTFFYRISDGTGFESGSQAMVLVVDPADALLARWTFDETNGVVVAEASGRGVSGRLSGGLDFAQDGVPGIAGRALHLDGAGYVECLNHYDPLDSSFTISVWVRPEVAPTSAKYLFKKGYGGDDWGGCNLVAEATRFRFYGNMFGNYSSSAFSAVANVPPQPNTWYHVVAQLDRTNNLARIWVNGVESTATANSRSLANGATGEYVVGNGTLTVGNSFQGALDDLRLYGKALSSAEITALYTSAGSIPAGGPAPADGERDVPLQPTLAWLPGRTNFQHDLYLGTNLAAVQAATTNSPEFKGRLSTTNYTPLAALLPSTQYFWRVDEILTGTNVAPGSVWTFATAVDALHGGLRLQLSLDSRDTIGTTTYDRAGPPFADGTLSAASPLVAAQVREGLDFNGTSQYVDIPALNLGVNTLTITAWIKRNGTQNSYAGLVFMRGSTASGLGLTTGSQLGYHWNDTAASYNFGSGLVLPDGEWAFAAMVIEPTRAVFYLGRTSGVLTAATNNTSHAVAALTGNFRLASDSSSSSRYFKGSLDEVGLWNRALSRAEIGQLLTNGLAGGGIDGPAPSPDPTTFTWIGTADAQWNNPANWATSGIPTAAATVFFNEASLRNLDTRLPQDFTVAGIRVSGGLRAVGISSAANALTLGAGGLQISNSFAAVTLGAPVTLAANQTWLVPQAASLAVNGSLTNGGRTLTLTNAGTVSFSAAFRGSGGLTLGGGGTVTLNANCTHSGQTTVNDATLVLAKGNWYSGSDLGSSTLVINSNGWVRSTTTHVFDASGSNPIRIYGGRLTFAAESYVNGSFEMTGGLFDGNGEWRFQGSPTFRAASVPAAVEVPQNWMANSRTYTVENGAADPDLIVSGSIFNGVNFTKAGAGTMRLRQAAAHTGTTTVSAGTLELAGGDDLLPAGTALSVSSGATLRLAEANQTVGSLAGGGAVQLGTGALTVNNAAASSFTGVISGTPSGAPPPGEGDVIPVNSGGLSKEGLGKLTLTANQAYTGDTLILQGTLALSGSGGLAGSSNLSVAAGATLEVTARTGGAITLASGQTLTGAGTVLGGVGIGSGATVSPGTGVGKLATGNETWASGGRYVWEISSATNASGRDQLTVTGTLNVTATPSGKFTLKLVTLGAAGLPGPLADFDPAQSYGWILATTTGGVLNLDPAAIAVDAAAFANPLAGGTFGVAAAGNNLMLNYQPYSPPVPAVFNRPAVQPDGAILLSGQGGTGQVYVLEAATILQPPVVWESILTNTASNGLFQFLDTRATNHPERFYRAR